MSKPIMKIVVPKFNIPENYLEHAQSIGGLCYQWSILESALVLLIEYLSGLDDKTTACLLSTSRDTSQRCEIASRLAILKVPHGPWRTCLLNTLSVIQNKMCEKRNRTVHDEWQFSENQILRINRAVKMPMDSEKVRQLVYETKTPVEVGEIEILIKEITIALLGITIMASQYRAKESSLKTLEPPEPLLQLYKDYFPEPIRKSAPKPKRQPKSSRKK